MAINVSAANGQAAQLQSYADRLQQAKNQLSSYKSSLAANWHGSEVPYITQGIDKAIAQIDAVIRELRSAANDVNSTAAAIKREDDAAAAAARARAARQQALAAAQAAYDKASEALKELLEERDALLKRLGGRKSLLQRYKAEIDKLAEKIEAAEKKCDECKDALAAARR